MLSLSQGDEAVFAFSPNPDSHAIILQHYGNFADVYVAIAEKWETWVHPKMRNLVFYMYGDPHENLHFWLVNEGE